MTRPSIFLATIALTFGTTGLGCSAGGGDDEPVAIETLFPADSEVGTFVEDAAAGNPGIDVADTDVEIEGLINGAAVAFSAYNFDVFAREFYTDGSTYQLELRVYQMPSAAVASDLYDHLEAEVSLYTANTWSDLTLGDASRIADTNGTSWWFNVLKGLHYIEVKINQGTIDDTVSRSNGEAFATAVADKIP